MKKHALKAIMTGLALLGSLEAVHLENYDGFLGGFKRKIFGMDDYLKNAQSVQDVFDQVVPLDERKNWKEVIGKFGVETHDGGCYRYWIPTNSNRDQWSERISISYDLKPDKVQKRQFKNIDEAYQVQKKNMARGGAALHFNKINDKEAIYEVIDEITRAIDRTILFGDWLICLHYEKNVDPQNASDWEKIKDLWIKRFNQVKFE
jgi:hypothetical protein